MISVKLCFARRCGCSMHGAFMQRRSMMSLPALNISKPTIYYYLGNKEQVLLECVTRGLGQLLVAAEESSRTTGNGLERLRVFLRRYAQINMDDFGRCVIRTGDEALSAEGAAQFRALKRKIDNALRSLIAQAVSDQSMVDHDVKLTAFTLAGALNWPARWHEPDGSKSAGRAGKCHG